jgi:hypothetical protein
MKNILPLLETCREIRSFSAALLPTFALRSGWPAGMFARAVVSSSNGAELSPAK